MNPQPAHSGQQPPQPSPYPPIPQQQHEYAQTAAAALSSATPPHLQHVPTPNNAAAPNGRKRKAGQPGSRGVANLTPEQLAKKRANDREAQRAIRERTKNTIEGLERRIRELESQQPYQELQRALQDRDRALQECEELKKRLSAVAGIVGNRDLGQTGLNGMVGNDDYYGTPSLTDTYAELAALTAQQTPLPPIQTHSQTTHYPTQPPPGQYEQAAPQPQQHLHPDLRSPGGSRTSDTPTSQSADRFHPEGGIRRWSPAQEQVQQYQPPPVSYDQSRPPPTAEMQHPQQPFNGSSHGERLGLNFLLEQHRHSPVSNVKPPTAPTITPTHASALQLITNESATCPLDNLLGDFITSQRDKLAKGMPVAQVIGPDRPTFSGLTHTESPRSAQGDPITAVLVDILSKFPDISHLPERIAVHYVMYHLIRWLICPCERCYSLIPEWVRPRAEAYENKHPTWQDYLPWPIMRTQLMLARTPGTQITFEDFFVPYTRTLSLNWPYKPESCLVESPGGPPRSELNPIFEQHLRRLDNWSLGKSFADEFPELVDDSVKIHDRS